jgi:hypothetical protein
MHKLECSYTKLFRKHKLEKQCKERENIKGVPRESGSKIEIAIE